MSNQIKELALPATLVVLLMVYPVAIIAADTGFNPSPITAVYSAGEWVVDRLTAKPKISFADALQQTQKEWNTDPYACMWDRNWIRKYKQDVCK